MSVVNTAGSADITKESKTKLLQNLRDEVVQLKLTATEHQETLDRVIKWFVTLNGERKEMGCVWGFTRTEKQCVWCGGGG